MKTQLYKCKKNGYWWIEVPGKAWPYGGYFDGRKEGRALATPVTLERAKYIQEHCQGEGIFGNPVTIHLCTLDTDNI